MGVFGGRGSKSASLDNLRTGSWQFAGPVVYRVATW